MKIAIVGYGNLGRGVEKAVAHQEDMELVGIFTRRNPADVKSESPVYSVQDIKNHAIDVAILCGGSATDLIDQGPELCQSFHTVDSFDTHARIPEYFAKMDAVAKQNGHLALISTGWDPGLFSLARILGQSVLPNCESYTFWGKGVSQGHSDAIRRIDGVLKAVQYTIPNADAMEKVYAGEGQALTTRDKHSRLCFVVPKPDADTEAIREAIVTMPNYFAEYDTTVHFIDEETFNREHGGMPHGGHVISRGETSPGTQQLMEFNLALDSNPEFTAAVNVAFARAVYRLAQEGHQGCISVFDVPFAYLSPKDGEALRRELL